MTEIPGLAAGSNVLFLFSKSQAASASRKPVFSSRAPGDEILARPGLCECRGKDSAGRRTVLANRIRRTRQAQRSGDDVRRDLVFDKGDAVAQLQFAFL